jgi:predicted extracellular nuclease
MSTTKHVLATGNFFWDWTDISKITVNDIWNDVPSIVGFLGQDITTSTGTNPQTLTTDSTLANDVDVIANQTSTTITNGGVAEFHLTDPVVALQGSGTADAPHLIIYLDATGRENIVFSFRARDIDGGISPGGNTDNAIQQIAVQYRVGGTGPWINLPAGYIADATTGPNTLGPDTLVSVTLPAGANGASDLQIRVITTNAVGNDEWVGIDDISVTSAAIPPGPGILSIADAAVAEGNAGTTPIVFTVNRSAGDDGAVTVDYAVTFTGAIAVADATDFAAGQIFSGTLSWADGDAAPKTITLNVQGDVVVEPSEKFTVTLSNATGGASISDATALGTITNDDTGPVPIFNIQGATHTSPFTGETVTTTGIVTAVDSNGYYLQDPSGDGNDATSDAIFVFTGGTPMVDVGGTLEPIAIGDSLTVTGTVTEFVASSTSLSVTELTGTTAVRNTQGNPPLAAVVIGTGGRLPPTENYEDDNFTSFDPATDALDFYESMEGMLVTIKAPLVVANTNEFGETWVVASGGAGATGINARDGITVSEGDFNPERIQIDDDANLSPGSYDPDHSQGDLLGDVTGILNYAFSSYEVLVTGAVTVTTDVTLGQETTALDGDSTHLTVATYNVENLDPTDPQAKFDAIASQIVNNLSSPDIVGLQEVQDADGPGNGSDLSGQATADKLIAAIVAAGGPTYQYVEVAPTSNNSTGGEPNGNIRNGFLYNPARVTYVPGSAELVDGPAFSGTRRPLAADFTFNGETVTVINNHFTSRGGSDPLMGDNQPPANAGDAARLAQAVALRAYIDSLAAGDPELNIVTLGDFNSYYFEAPLEALQAGAAMTNLFDLLPEEERYSYMFEGNLQPFDNILVSPNLPLTSSFDAVHLNAEQPDGPSKPTDHDPTLASILISANDIIIDSAGNDVRRSGAGNDFFFLPPGGNDSASGGTGHDVFFFGGSMTSADEVDGGDGTDQIALQGDYSGGLTFGTDVTGVEALAILPGNDTRFGDPGTNLYDYDVTTVNENVAAGTQMTVDASRLRIGEDFTFDGSAETDGSFFIYGGNGTDDLTGGANNDVFLFGAQGQWGASDRVDGGPGGIDQLALRGDYTIAFGATQLTGIESIGLVSAFHTRFGALGETYHYDLTMNDGNVAGIQMTVDAAPLHATETLTFNGAAEDDGSFRVFGGAGADVIAGSQNADIIVGRLGADTLTGNGGNDVFRYNAAADSTSAGRDEILDFASGDLVDLSRIDADTTVAGDQAFSFIGTDAFNNVAGELRYQSNGGTEWLVQGDTDGDGSADFELILNIPVPDPITSGDFIL